MDFIINKIHTGYELYSKLKPLENFGFSLSYVQQVVIHIDNYSYNIERYLKYNSIANLQMYHFNTKTHTDVIHISTENNLIKICVDLEKINKIISENAEYLKETETCKNVWQVKKIMVESLLRGNGFSLRKDIDYNYDMGFEAPIQTYSGKTKTWKLLVTREMILNSNIDEFKLVSTDNINLTIGMIQKEDFPKQISKLIKDIKSTNTKADQDIEKIEQDRDIKITQIKETFYKAL